MTSFTDMSSQQRAEWIEQQFGVSFVLRPDPVDGTPESTLTEQEVATIVNSLTDKLTSALLLIERLVGGKAAVIQKIVESIPPEVVASAHKIQAALEARIDYDVVPEEDHERKAETARRWMDLEKELSDAEYEVYIAKWQAQHSVGGKVIRAMDERVGTQRELGKLTPAGAAELSRLTAARRPGETIVQAEQRLRGVGPLTRAALDQPSEMGVAFQRAEAERIRREREQRS